MTKDVEKRIEKLENALKEQEHRITKIVPNIVKYGFDDTNVKRRNAVWKALIGYLLRRHTVTVIIAVISGIIAIVSLVVAINSNRLFKFQNKLIQNQNKRITQQTYLQEAERRSSFVYLMNSIFEGIQVELREDYNKNNIRDLSPELIGGISALSRVLIPYRMLDGDSLSQLTSPERGQLLLMILESNLDTTTLKKIYRGSDFSYSNLRNLEFEHYYMKKIKLNQADLSNSVLFDIDFDSAQLVSANFNDTNISSTSFRDCFLEKSQFINSTVSSTSFKGASLLDMDNNGMQIYNGVSFRGARVREEDWVQGLDMENSTKYYFIDTTSFFDTIGYMNYETYEYIIEVLQGYRINEKQN